MELETIAPTPRTTEGDFLLAFDGGILDAESQSLTLGGRLRSNGAIYESLQIPIGLLIQFPGWIEVCINDGLPRATSLCPGEKDPATGAWIVDEVPVDLSLPREPGSAEVSPYVPYRTQSTFIE